MKLVSDAYGKTGIHVAVLRRADGIQYIDQLKIAIQLKGTFEKAYYGENDGLLTTDAMKNIVNRLAREEGIQSMEVFADLLTRYFLKNYEPIKRVTIRCVQTPWRRMSFDGELHPHAFDYAPYRFTCKAVGLRDKVAILTSGFKKLIILKTTGSAFTGFLRDHNTMLPETKDRIMATSVKAKWKCTSLDVDWAAARQSAVEATRRAFAMHDESKSVQETLRFVSEAVMTACPAIVKVKMKMPNLHYILMNLTALGLDNPNLVFLPTKEPSGLIEGAVAQ